MQSRPPTPAHDRAPLWPYAFLVLIHLVVGAGGYFPVIHPDEGIYREVSRYFAGVGATLLGVLIAM